MESADGVYFPAGESVGYRRSVARNPRATCADLGSRSVGAKLSVEYTPLRTEHDGAVRIPGMPV